MVLNRKNKSDISHLIKFEYINLGQNLKVYFNKKLISYFIIFETNKYVYRNGYVRGC